MKVTFVLGNGFVTGELLSDKEAKGLDTELFNEAHFRFGSKVIYVKGAFVSGKRIPLLAIPEVHVLALGSEFAVEEFFVEGRPI